MYNVIDVTYSYQRQQISMFIFNYLHEFVKKDGSKEEVDVKAAGDRGEQLLSCEKLTFERLFQKTEDADDFQKLLECFTKVNNAVFPLLPVEDEQYEDVKKYLIEKTSSHSLEEALNNSHGLKSALCTYKNEIANKLGEYVSKQEEEIKECTIMDKLIIERATSRHISSVKRKRTLDLNNKSEKKRKKIPCIYFQQGHCNRGKRCKFTH